MEERGLVVKIKGKSCIVLTPEGEYRKVPLPKDGTAGVGREIHLERKKSLPYLRHFMVAASLLIFILAGQLFNGKTPQAAAYLTIDINPSVELGVSVDKKVVSARGLNSDGERVLSEVRIKGHDLSKAVELIVAQAVVDQYLQEKDDNVILATLTVDGDAEPMVDLDSVYEAIRSPVESGGVNAEVIIEPVRPEMRQEAAKSGISTGRYLLLQKLDKKGVPVSVNEIKSQSLGKLEKEKKVSFIDMVDENDDRRERKEDRVIKRGVYVERNNSKVKAGDKPNERIVTPEKSQQNDDGGKIVAPERVVNRYKDEKQDSRPDRRSNDDGKRKADDSDRNDRNDDERNREGHQRQGRGD